MTRLPTMHLPRLVLAFALLSACASGDVDDSGWSDTDTFVDTDTQNPSKDADQDSYPDGADCNDDDAAINPGATELCDGVDNDCDEATDEDVTTTYFADTDGDTHGDAAATKEACTPPEGYVTNSTDCDDKSNVILPGATEVCDGIDNDCDEATDEDVTTTYYADTDGDTYGDATASQAACTQPEGFVTNTDDCNDDEVAAYTDAAEACDDIDNDCDGSEDEGCPLTCARGTLYTDTAGSTCFEYVEVGATWDAAELACVALGGHLAIIDSPDENTAVRDLTTTTVQAWIGFSDTTVNGQSASATEFVDPLGGTTADYHNFMGGEPNGGTNENCVSYFEAPSWDPELWNDSPCANVHPYVCEYEATP